MKIELVIAKFKLMAINDDGVFNTTFKFVTVLL